MSNRRLFLIPLLALVVACSRTSLIDDGSPYTERGGAERPDGTASPQPGDAGVATPIDSGAVDIRTACLGDQNVFLYREPQRPDLLAQGVEVTVTFGDGPDGLPNQVEASSGAYEPTGEWSATFAALGFRTSLVPGVYAVNSNNVEITRYSEGAPIFDGEFQVLELSAVPYDGGLPREFHSLLLTFQLGERSGCLHIVDAKEYW